MAKYEMKTFVDAEQYLLKKNKLPAGVISDGPRSPETDSRAAYIVKTEEGITYLHDGDYIVTRDDGTRYVVQKTEFEEVYTLVKE